GDMEAVVLDLANLTAMLVASGEIAQARTTAAEALRLTTEIGARRLGVEAVESAAALAVEMQEWARAARWVNAAMAHRRASGSPPPPDGQQEFDELARRVRGAFGEQA